MPNDNQYCRVILDVECEVTDEASLATYLFDFGTNEDGEIGMVEPDPDLPGVPNSRQQYRVGRALTMLLFEELQKRNVGLRPLSASTVVRGVTEDGHRYTKLEFPEFPRRQEDGNFRDFGPPAD